MIDFPHPDSGDLRVGEWLVLSPLNRIRRGDEERQLEPKLVELLCFLAAHPRRVLSKQELIEGVWNGQFLSDSALTRTVSELRRALDDDAQAPRYIETIPKRGYRLVAPVATPTGETPHRPSRRVAKWPWLTIGSLGLGIAALIALRAGGGGAGREERAIDPDPSVRLRQITTGEDLEVHPTVSPDGSRLAYSSSRTGALELWVRQLVPGGQDLQLTDDGQQNLGAAWSPDGRFIAYQSEGRGGIWLLPAMGGEARRLTRFGGAPSWSPDGRSLVFHSAGGFELLLSSLPAMPPSTLWRVSIDGGEPIPVTEPGWPPGGHGAPAWSPSGEWIAFVASDLGGTKLWLIRPDGRDARALDRPFGPRAIAWAPDGASLFWAGIEQGDDWVGRTEVGPRGFGASEPLVRVALRQLSVQPDGRALLGSRLEQRSRLWVVEVDPASGLPRDEPRPLTRGTHSRDTRPAIAPDGARVAFTRSRPGQKAQLFLVDATPDAEAEGEAAQLILDDELAAHSPVWLGDGDEILFASADPEGLSVRRVDVRTHEVRDVTRIAANWRALRPSNSGSRVAFYTTPRGEAANVWIAPLEDPSQASQITFDDGFVGFPVWSPDDRHLAVELARPYGYQLAVVPADGGELRQLTDEPGEHWPGSWSPDGRRILFVAAHNGVWSLRWVDRDGGESGTVLPGEGLDVYLRYPDWAPTGDRIVYERGELEADLWEIELPAAPR